MRVLARLPIRLRLTVWYAFTLGVSMILLSTAIYVSTRQMLYADLDRDLQRNAQSLAERLEHEFDEGESGEHASSSLVRKSLFHNLSLEIVADDGTLVAASEDLGEHRLTPPGGLSTVPTLREGHARYELSPSDLDPAGVEVAALRVRHSNEGREYVLVAGAGRSGVDAALGALRRPILTLTPLLLILAVTGGWWLAWRALAPVTAMAEQARRMGADRLGNRLDIVNPDDELGALAKTFNELLDRLQSAFERMKQFMADASHEVRTPVAVIRSGATVALTSPVTLDECVETLEIISDQTVRMSRLVDDMFFLARADAGAIRVDVNESVDLSDLIARCIRTASPLAKERGIEIGRSDEEGVAATCAGDAARLEQLLMNLLINGINHLRPGDEVRVDVRTGAPCAKGSVCLEVRDTGPGIPNEDRETVFERFRRLDASRSRDTGGSGLGLPIARWIAEAHGGTLTLSESCTGGCTFTVTLPQGTLRDARMRVESSGL